MESVKNKSGIELVIFEKIRVIVGEGSKAGLYFSRIEDIINGGIIISQPDFVSGHSGLRNGADVCVQIARQDAAYQFYSRIHTKKTGGPKQVILTPPKRLERVQRRMFARVDMATPIIYGELPDEIDWTNWEQQITWHKTLSTNVSGGGVLMRLPEKMETGQLAVMQIEIFSEANLPKYVPMVCRRAFESEDLLFGGFEYIDADDLGLHFKSADLAKMPKVLKSFSGQAQDRLVALLFNKQIEQRQKGAL
jgi:c-di-GMP-binding flagellar brake protein YcgR